jgi:hypothetical protein
MSITSRTIAIVLAMAMVAVISYAGTRAAFSGETENAGNEFDSATIDLTDDDGDVVMFNVAGMLPGDSLDHCILVTYTGPAGRDSSGVKVFIPSYTPPAGVLDADLLITVEEGTDATPVFDPAGTRTGVQDGLACSGFTPVTAVITDEPLSTFATTYAAGYGAWTPIVTDTNTTQYYRITVKLATASTAQGESVTAIPFTWRVEAGS